MLSARTQTATPSQGPCSLPAGSLEPWPAVLWCGPKRMGADGRQNNGLPPHPHPSPNPRGRTLPLSVPPLLVALRFVVRCGRTCGRRSSGWTLKASASWCNRPCLPCRARLPSAPLRRATPRPRPRRRRPPLTSPRGGPPAAPLRQPARARLLRPQPRARRMPRPGPPGGATWRCC